MRVTNHKHSTINNLKCKYRPISQIIIYIVCLENNENYFFNLLEKNQYYKLSILLPSKYHGSFFLIIFQRQTDLVCL